MTCFIMNRTPVKQSKVPPEGSNMNPEQIRALLEANLAGCRAQVSSDDNTHFEATVISEAFAGKLPLQRHQMVYGALGDKIGGDIHALSIKALTPEEAQAS
jgi:acid stress-induced BolA-like protein IbaG/YrbA